MPSETGVSVSTGVFVGASSVSVGGGGNVSVGGIGVSVGTGVKVDVGTFVSVGGTGELDGVRDGTWDGVRDGTWDGVSVAGDLTIRVRVGGSGVQVINGLVGVMYEIEVKEGVMDSVKLGVAVGMYSEISTAVRAPAVLIGLEKAESTTSCAPKSEALDVLGLVRAAAETMQIRLKPITPAARTVKGPEYSRIFTLATWPFQFINHWFMNLQSESYFDQSDSNKI